MLVSDLHDVLGRTENSAQVPLSQVRVTDDGTALQIRGQENELELDELGLKEIGKYLSVSPNYLAKCPPELRATNLNYWLDKNPEMDTVFNFNTDHQITLIHSPERIIIPAPRVGEIIDRVFQPGDEILELVRDDKRLHLDIKVDNFVEVPGDDTEWRPAVGDITDGGVRFYLPSTFEEEKPTISPYLFRRVCSNGLDARDEQSIITLKGKTVPDILAEMEASANQVLAGLDNTLQEYKQLAEVTLPGNILNLIRQYGQEHNLPLRVVNRVMDAAAQISSEREPDMYDITNLFTEVANSSVSYGTRMRLQRLGGHLTNTREQQIHRCNSCERPLADWEH